MQKTKVITGKVVVSFPHLDRPSKVGNDEKEVAKYGVTIIISKDDKATINAIKAAIEAAKQEAKDKKWKGVIPAKVATCLMDGDEEKPDRKEYENSLYVHAKSTDKPGIVDGDRDVLDAKEVYPGGIARASITFYGYEANGKKGVACALNNLQFYGGGTRLSAVKADAFDDFEDELL